MRKISRLALGGALLASTLAGFGADASDNACDDKTVIFSRLRQQVGYAFVNVPSVNANALTCLADIFGVKSGDNRRLAPNANQVSIRYIDDLGPVTLVAVLNGLGFTNFDEFLTVYTPLDPETGLGGTYDSANRYIPAPGSGVISADVYLVEVNGQVETRTLLDSVHFRSFDQI